MGYCAECGEAVREGAAFCSVCGARWSPRPFADVAGLGQLLEEVERLREEAVIDESAAGRLRDRYEARLLALRGGDAPGAVATAAIGARERGWLSRALDPAGAAAAGDVAAGEDVPPAQPREPRPSFGEWAAARQADILLYLGAFILSVAALIFVNYQGEALSEPGRFAILLGYTVSFLLLGLVLPRWERVREAGPVFLLLGAVLVPVSIVALRTLVLDGGELPDDLLWLGGATLTAALYLGLAARGYGRLYAVPGVIAALVAWGALGAVLDLRDEWFGTWYALPATALTAAAGLGRGRWARPVEAGGLLLGGLALLYAHVAAAFDNGHRQAYLPLTYGVILTGMVVAARLRGSLASLALLPPMVAGGLAALLWSAGVGPPWWYYAAVAVAAVLLATLPRWRGREVVAASYWLAILAAALVPVLFAERYREAPAHGLAASLTAGALLVVMALRSRGGLARQFAGAENEAAARAELPLLGGAAGAYSLLAAAYANGWAGVGGGERAWAFLGIGVAAWLALAAFGRGRDALLPLAVGGVAAVGIAAALARDAPGRAALILLICGVAALLPVRPTGRPLLLIVGVAQGAAALVFAWRWRGLDAALLPLAYAGTAAVFWGALLPERRYRAGERTITVVLLSWGFWLLALTTALVLLARRAELLPADTPLARRREWAVLVVVVAFAALAVLGEGLRLRERLVIVGGTAGLMAALLLGIATREPANVQAYTLPLGLYLVLLGVLLRRTPMLVEPHLTVAEAATVLGLLVLTLPAAEQGFAPDGGRYGLELIGMGLLFLVAGLTLPARWLVVGGVLTLSGVAIRWLTTGSDIPYWLTLGLLGMALLAIGVLLLLQRDRWDAAAAGVRRWWRGGDG